MKPTRKQPLFIITGASGIGKTTACAGLFAHETDYIVLESDICWHEVYNTPQDQYRAYRRMWLRLCANISQIGLPCVLCGCNTPQQLEELAERALFTEIHYLAVVGDDACLRARLTQGRGVTDADWIASSLHFNRWLREHAAETIPPITLVDATHLTPEETSAQIERWIRARFVSQAGANAARESKLR